ncbi:MAG: CFI-box-CTERM domain-containing protein [Bacteriovorax sp.]|nr:CFI-box-CTERM domain-containing protein [Bacteriovorax sp.]
MKLISVLIFICLISKLYAADTIAIYDPSNFVVTATIGTTTFNLGVDSAGASSEETAAHVYVPIQTAFPNEIDYSIFKSQYGLTRLLDITNAADTVSYPLSVTASVTGNPKYVYAAVKFGTSGYYVVAQSDPISSSVTNSSLSFKLTPLDICKAIIAQSLSTVCNVGGTLYPTTATAGAVFKPMVYFFVGDQGIAITGSTLIVPTGAGYTGGLYFDTQMSSQVPSSTFVTLSGLRKGDKRLLGSFATSAIMDPSLFRKIIIYQYSDNSTPISSYVPIASAGVTAGTILDRDFGTAQSGDLVINNLTNGLPYKFSIAFQDRFYFATPLSPSSSGTPTEIQELLKKQACYLLTAGFGEEHYVITFFRHYRDQILANTWIGQQFIKVYYRSAPHYAVIIYQSEWMRSGIRMMAYGLYFLFNYYWLVLIFAGIFLFLNLWKNKIILENNRL